MPTIIDIIKHDDGKIKPFPLMNDIILFSITNSKLINLLQQSEPRETLPTRGGQSLPSSIVLTDAEYRRYSAVLKNYLTTHSRQTTLPELFEAFTTAFDWDSLNQKAQVEGRDCNDVAMELIGSFLLVLERMGLINQAQFVVQPSDKPVLLVHRKGNNPLADKRFVYDGLFNSNVHSVHATAEYGIYHAVDWDKIRPGTLLVSGVHTMVVKNVTHDSRRAVTAVNVVYSQGRGRVPLAFKTYSRGNSYVADFTPYQVNWELVTSPELRSQRKYASLQEAFHGTP